MALSYIGFHLTLETISTLNSHTRNNTGRQGWSICKHDANTVRQLATKGSNSSLEVYLLAVSSLIVLQFHFPLSSWLRTVKYMSASQVSFWTNFYLLWLYVWSSLLIILFTLNLSMWCAKTESWSFKWVAYSVLLSVPNETDRKGLWLSCPMIAYGPIKKNMFYLNNQ